MVVVFGTVRGSRPKKPMTTRALLTSDLIWSVTPVPQNKGSPGTAQLPLPLPRARDEAYSQRRARAFPAGSGLATAARREPSLPGPPRRPAPPSATPGLPASPCPALAGLPTQPPVEQAASSGAKGGQGAGRWLHGQALSYAPVMPPLRCLAQPERAGPLSGLARPPLRREPPASHPSGAAAWPAPEPVVVIGRASEENGPLIKATSQ
jgi:hypothetical protein